MNCTKISKAQFIRELTANGARWVYCCWSRVDSYDREFVADYAHDIANDMRNGCFFETRSYTKTSSYRVKSHTGSILDLNSHDTVYRFADGFMVENEYNRWCYVLAC